MPDGNGPDALRLEQPQSAVLHVDQGQDYLIVNKAMALDLLAKAPRRRFITPQGS